MRVELYERLIQITIEKESYFSQKADYFANKYFADKIRLSNSLLVLDTQTNRFKKDYFLNWAYHMGSHMDESNTNVDYQTITKNSHLPIRIKYIDQKSVVEHIHIEMKFLSQERIMLRLDKQNRLARRYLISTFRDHMVGYSKKELYLDNTRPSFWEKLMNSLTEKTIFNVALKFDYDQWKVQDMMLGGFAKFSGSDSSYLTREERQLRRSYAVLECDLDDPFEAVRNKYIRMAREYHPDNVYGQDHKVIESYTEQFRNIQEAFEIIKNSHTHHLAA